MTAPDDFPMTVTLQPRTPGLNFPWWLAECRRCGYRVLLAWDESHASAQPKEKDGD